MKKEILVLLLLLLISFPAVRSLLLPGGFTSHDLTHHVIRQISMDKLLSEGQFPPRWSGELNEGFGYPVFLFNYPLPSLVGEGFHLLGLGFVDSVKAVLLISLIGSVLTMYLFLRAFFGSKYRLAALIGAIFYLYAPIRFLNIYVSAAVGASLSLVFVPLLFWAILRLFQGRKKNYILPGSLSLAGLIISHNVTTLIFAPVLLGFILLLVVYLKRRPFVSLIIMLLLGMGLSAWFWLPALVEKQYLRYDEILVRPYVDQFPTLWQLIRSPWGYGLSHPKRPEPGDMSYQLGLVHIGVILVGLAMLWFYRRRSQFLWLGSFAVVLFVASVLLMLNFSLPLWDTLHFLGYVQFPLRFSVVSVFAAAIMAGLLVKYLPFRQIIFVVLLILVLYANRNHWYINQKFDPGEQYYLSLKTTTSAWGEHLPRWGRIATSSAQDKLQFIEGMGRITILKDQSGRVVAMVEASDPAKLRLNQFYFPGWEIRVDGQKAPFNYLAEGESYGLPVFDIPEGKHQVLAEFKNTLIRNLADLLSIASLGLVVIYLLYEGGILKVRQG